MNLPFAVLGRGGVGLWLREQGASGPTAKGEEDSQPGQDPKWLPGLSGAFLSPPGPVLSPSGPNRAPPGPSQDAWLC